MLFYFSYACYIFLPISYSLILKPVILKVKYYDYINRAVRYIKFNKTCVHTSCIIYSARSEFGEPDYTRVVRKETPFRFWWEFCVIHEEHLHTLHILTNKIH